MRQKIAPGETNKLTLSNTQVLAALRHLCDSHSLYVLLCVRVFVLVCPCVSLCWFVRAVFMLVCPCCLYVGLSVLSLCWFVRGVFVLVCLCVCLSGCPPGEEVLLARIQPEVLGGPFGELPISNKRRILLFVRRGGDGWC